MSNKLKIKVGCTTELKVQTKVMEEGFMVSVPYGDCSRYDQIWDINGKLLKVQVKHACEVYDVDGPFGFKIPGCSSSGFAQKIVDGITKLFIKKPYTSEEIDGIATVYNDKCYFIPIDQIRTDTHSIFIDKEERRGRLYKAKNADRFEFNKYFNIQEKK